MYSARLESARRAIGREHFRKPVDLGGRCAGRSVDDEPPLEKRKKAVQTRLQAKAMLMDQSCNPSTISSHSTKLFMKLRTMRQK